VEAVLEHLQALARAHDVGAHGVELRLAPLELGLGRGQARLGLPHALAGRIDSPRFGGDLRLEARRSRPPRRKIALEIPRRGNRQEKKTENRGSQSSLD
jgi:hypothetical protein